VEAYSLHLPDTYNSKTDVVMTASEQDVKKRGRETVVMPAKPTERLFSSVGLVKSDLWGSLLDSTLIDVMWAKQVP
jgi:hypothetical protein